MEEIKQYNKSIEKEYTQFKLKIKNEIQQKSIKTNSYEKCCLIYSDFIKEIFKIENYNRYGNVYFFSEKKPKLIINISKEINEKFEIIKKDLLILYENACYNNYKCKKYKIVNNARTFNYVAGYNKLIIISEKSALLILNPIDSIINNNNYVIGIIVKYNNSNHNYNNELYKLLITGDLDINNNITNLKLKSNLIVDESEENYKNNEDIRKILEKIKSYRRKILLNNNRILIFVNLYYYEKNLRQIEKDKAFKEFEDYYLINNDWLDKYKQDNNYEKISSILKKYEEKNKYNYFDYYNLNNYTFTFLNDLVDIIKLELSDILDVNLNEINKIEENFNKIFIMHKRIIQLILDDENIKKENLESKKVKVIGSYIYIISKVKLNIGTLNENLEFNTKYVINYISNAIYNEEIAKLFVMQFDEYLKLRKCNVNVKQEKSRANLYEGNNKKLGSILIIGGKKDKEEASKKENIKLISSDNNENQVIKKNFEKTILALKKTKKILLIYKSNMIILKSN